MAMHSPRDGRHRLTGWTLLTLTGRVVGRGPDAGVEMAKQLRKTRPGTRAPALDRALGDAEHPCGVGDRVALHVDRHDGGPLLKGKAHQCVLYPDRGFDLSSAIRHRVDVFQRGGPMSLGAPQPVQAGVDHDPVQPAADRGVIPEGTGAAVRRQHGVLQRVFCILATAGGQPRQPVQLAVMTSEQLGESVAIAGDVGCQQLGVTALALNAAPISHGRDSNQSVVVRHFT
jgi:hypothetical protein